MSVMFVFLTAQNVMKIHPLPQVPPPERSQNFPFQKVTKNNVSVLCFKIGEMTEPHQEGPIQITFTYKGNFKKCRGGKRKLNRDQRDTYSHLMLKEKQSASRVQKVEAARLMKVGDKGEPASLPTLNTLRIIKCRDKKSQHSHSNPILSIIEMMEHQPYSYIFRDIGYKPFFIHYWSAAQVNAYRIYTRQTKVPAVSIDATGGLIQRMNSLPNVPTRAIFLYEIAVHDPEKKIQFPVANMLSERHHNTAIGFWLLSWL